MGVLLPLSIRMEPLDLQEESSGEKKTRDSSDAWRWSPVTDKFTTCLSCHKRGALGIPMGVAKLLILQMNGNLMKRRIYKTPKTQAYVCA